MSPPDLASICRQIPLLRDLPIEEFTITPLAGYTNHTVRLQTETADWVLRIPKPATDSYIDRAAEAHNQELAADLQLAPTVAWRDESGLSLTPTLAGQALQADDLNQAGCLARVAAAIGRLHHSGLRFAGQVNPGELIERYYQLLPAERQQTLRPRLLQARDQLEWLRERDLPLVASHNDLELESLLVDGNHIWMIDWEFSAMASPYWDLATLCNAAQLSESRAREFIQAYCAGDRQMKESVLAVYRNLLMLLSDCWMQALVPETE